MKLALGIFLLVIILPHNLSSESPSVFVVWNVGQGLWTTWIHQKQCDHFDLGGEFSPVFKVKTWCAQRQNRIWLSHADQDHIQFVASAFQQLPSTCWQEAPAKPWPSRISQVLEKEKKCPASQDNKIQIFRPVGNFHNRDRNHGSRVVNVDRFLVPGDSTRSEEKIWDERLKLDHTQVLVLGHHGSRTSTSEHLLNHLPKLLMAVASARKRRFGHPHIETEIAIKLHGVALLKTEDWGSIGFVSDTSEN